MFILILARHAFASKGRDSAVHSMRIHSRAKYVRTFFALFDTSEANMNSLFEGRGSDSPYIEAVWRGQAGSAYAPICPASSHWHLLFLRQNGKVKVSVVGPSTRATPVTQAEGTEWFGVTFPLGTFLPFVAVRNLLDEQAILPLSAKTSFGLAGSSFQFPDYENVETFVNRLVRENMLVSDPIVRAV